MNREEAIEAIKEAYGNSEYTDEIIKALEQEPEQKGSYHPIISGNSQNPPKVKSAESEE